MEQKEDKTPARVMHNLIIMDESGSMNSIRLQAISGANETLMTIRQAQEQMPQMKQMLTFVTFSSCGHGQDIRTIFQDLPITMVRDLTMQDYVPKGCTPLYDAMGTSLARLQTEVGNDEYALVTIITDGLENASHEYSGKAIKDIVSLLREKGWTFAYIGANQDAVEVARDLSIDNALNYDATPQGTKVMSQRLCASSMHYYRARSDGRILKDGEFFDNKDKKNK